MSRNDTPADRPRQTSVPTGDRHAASAVPAYATFFKAEPIDRIKMIRQGILASDAKRILFSLAVTEAAAMVALGIPFAAMNRRVKGQGRLPPAESERVLGVARLVGRIQDIVEESGNPQEFDAVAWMSRWLAEPLPALGGVRPLDLLDTMEGQALISNTLAHVQGGAHV